MDLNFARCQLHALSLFGIYKPLVLAKYEILHLDIKKKNPAKRNITSQIENRIKKNYYPTHMRKEYSN